MENSTESSIEKTERLANEILNRAAEEGLTVKEVEWLPGAIESQLKKERYITTENKPIIYKRIMPR